MSWKTLSDIRQSLLTDKLLTFLSEKKVYRHKFSFAYLLGGMTLFFIAVQIISGVLLLTYYSPTPSTAYESVTSIMTSTTGGWLVRSIHYWSANLLVVTLLLHFGSTYFLRAYRSPRELTWISGVVLLFLVLGFCFTGSLLPWDMRAYFATEIGTEIPRSVPLIGPFVVSLLRGSSVISAESLTRLFALHVSILPLLTLVVIGFHLILNLAHGSSLPPGTPPGGEPFRFYPTYLFREGIAWTACAFVLMWLSVLLPIQQGPKADPFVSPPAGIKPDWYFLPLYETLKYAPASIFAINGEFLVNLGVLVIGLLFVFVPWIDKRSAPDRWSRWAIVAGAVLAGYFLTMTILALAGI